MPYPRLLLLLILPFLAVACEAVPSMSARELNHTLSPGCGFSLHTAAFEGRRRSYWVFLPDHYDPSHQYPAILYLHGLTQGGFGGIKVENCGIGPYLFPRAKTFPFILIFPQSNGWWNDTDDLDDAMRVLTVCQTRYAIDPDRVAVFGVSRGGYGAWALAARYTSSFSCAVTCSAPAEPRYAPRLAALPTWSFHYASDPIVPESNTEKMVSLIRQGGGRPRFTRIPGFSHYSWQAAFDADLFAWVLQQDRRHRILPAPVYAATE